MSSGFLDFFILEASEYVEQLDGLLARASATNAPVDTEALARNARALRGSATMAKLTPFAELSTALERVGRGLREGTVSWSPAVAGALVAAVDDLKILIRAVRNWSGADDQRATARAAELTRIAPAATPAAATAATPGASGTGFFAAESSNIAAGLELLATRPNDRDAATNVLRRVRAIRGVAGIKDVAPLADVMAGAELVAKPLELARDHSTPIGLPFFVRRPHCFGAPPPQCVMESLPMHHRPSAMPSSTPCPSSRRASRTPRASSRLPSSSTPMPDLMW